MNAFENDRTITMRFVIVLFLFPLGVLMKNKNTFCMRYNDTEKTP